MAWFIGGGDGGDGEGDEGNSALGKYGQPGQPKKMMDAGLCNRSDRSICWDRSTRCGLRILVRSDCWRSNGRALSGGNPIGADQAGVPAHWSVTFGTDDADATAARATELGGTVMLAPFDGPWVRMTIIRDPQGATFIASKFVPENRDLGSQ